MTNEMNLKHRYHPSLGDRQAAERKLCRLFASFGIDASGHRDRLIDPFIIRAMPFWRPHSGLDLASLALEEAVFDLNAWFAAVLGLDRDDACGVLTEGRAAFFFCVDARWGSHAGLLLMPIDELPAGFIDAMQEQVPPVVPPIVDGDMHRQPYEAWSIHHLIGKALPIERRVVQVIGDVLRRHGRALGFGWRDLGPTP